MKKIALVIGLIGLMSSCKEMNEGPSKEILANFNQKFPHTENVHWQEGKGEQWMVNFTGESSGNYEVKYNEKGEWLETQLDLPESLIPVGIVKTLDSLHSERKFIESTLTQKPTGDSYDVKIKKEDYLLQISFDLNGKELKIDTLVD
jgi:hypothetical protein